MATLVPNLKSVDSDTSFGKDLKGARALVTGASSGIGKAVALALARHGADLALVGRSTKRLAETASDAKEHGSRAFEHSVDLTKDSEVEQLVDQVRANFQGLDVLVHSAGAIHHSRVESASVGDFDDQLRANLRAPYVLTKTLLPFLVESQGQIVFVNSSQGLRAAAGNGQFAATQHGLRALADSLRDEVNEYGVRVLSVYLGRTATPRIRDICAKEGRQYRPELLMQPEDVAAMILHALSLPRTAEVTDLRIRPMKKSY